MGKCTQFSVLAGTAFLAALGSLHANPTGGSVAAGAATIATSGSTVTVTQGSDRAVINWGSFSIGAGETTTFLQPSASSAVLNRVTGGNPTAIYGTLNATGQVYVINSAGVLVGPGGAINTAGFLASTLDVPNGDFIAGGALHFQGTGAAGVQNLGHILADGGDVVLIGHTVSNAGSLSAPRGVAALAAGNDVVYTPAADQRISVRSGIASGAARGVDNAGTISAAQAELKAAGGNVYGIAVNNGGSVQATGFANVGGRILLTSAGGKVALTGTLKARNADGSGGQIYVGGGAQGRDASIDNAAMTVVSPAAVIDASGDGAAGGGKVVVWSDSATFFEGTLLARGGAAGGDGGSAEISSGGYLSFTGAADLSAPHGHAGSLLFDPLDLLIGHIGTDLPNINGDGTTGDDITTATELADPNAYSGATSVILDNTVRTLLSTSDVTLAATRDVTIDAPLLLVSNDHSATIQAGRDINLSNFLGGSGTGRFTLLAGRNITVSGAGGPGYFSASVPIVFVAGQSDSTGKITVQDGTGGGAQFVSDTEFFAGSSGAVILNGSTFGGATSLGTTVGSSYSGAIGVGGIYVGSLSTTATGTVSSGVSVQQIANTPASTVVLGPGIVSTVPIFTQPIYIGGILGINPVPGSEVLKPTDIAGVSFVSPDQGGSSSILLTGSAGGKIFSTGGATPISPATGSGSGGRASISIGVDSGSTPLSPDDQPSGNGAGTSWDRVKTGAATAESSAGSTSSSPAAPVGAGGASGAGKVGAASANSTPAGTAFGSAASAGAGGMSIGAVAGASSGVVAQVGAASAVASSSQAGAAQTQAPASAFAAVASLAANNGNQPATQGSQPTDTAAVTALTQFANGLPQQNQSSQVLTVPNATDLAQKIQQVVSQQQQVGAVATPDAEQLVKQVQQLQQGQPVQQPQQGQILTAPKEVTVEQVQAQAQQLQVLQKSLDQQQESIAAHPPAVPVTSIVITQQAQPTQVVVVQQIAATLSVPGAQSAGTTKQQIQQTASVPPADQSAGTIKQQIQQAASAPPDPIAQTATEAPKQQAVDQAAQQKQAEILKQQQAAKQKQEELSKQQQSTDQAAKQKQAELAKQQQAADQAAKEKQAEILKQQQALQEEQAAKQKQEAGTMKSAAPVIQLPPAQQQVILVAAKATLQAYGVLAQVAALTGNPAAAKVAQNSAASISKAIAAGDYVTALGLIQAAKNAGIIH